MLVERRGILCSAMPQGITIKKQLQWLIYLHEDMSNLMNSELGYVPLEDVDGSEVDLPQ